MTSSHRGPPTKGGFQRGGGVTTILRRREARRREEWRIKSSQVEPYIKKKESLQWRGRLRVGGGPYETIGPEENRCIGGEIHPSGRGEVFIAEDQREETNYYP